MIDPTSPHAAASPPTPTPARLARRRRRAGGLFACVLALGVMGVMGVMGVVGVVGVMGAGTPAQAAGPRAASGRGGDTLTLQGEVIAVIDGDTLEILDAQRDKHRIRLAGIDAPEHDQAHGEAATQALTALAMRRPVLVTGRKVDKWQRLVGQVWLDGLDVNLELVKSGHAWHDRLHLREQTAVAQRLYGEAEADARAEHLGLWAMPDPVPPAVFRRLKDLGRTIDATAR